MSVKQSTSRGLYKSLNLKQKLEVLECVKSGMNYKKILEKFNITKSTFYDIKKNKDKLKSFVESETKSNKNIIRLREPNFKKIDSAVYTWYCSQRSSGVPIRGIEIQTAAIRFAQTLGEPDFKASGGWLSRFRKRHGILNRKVVGEALSADTENAELFKSDFKIFVQEQNLSDFQIYNADETGIFWKTMPDTTQAGKSDKNVSGHKQPKDRLSVLCCANANGSHRNTLAVVGKSKKPRVLKDIMDKLPVHYYNSKKAWFDQRIFNEWFSKKFISEVRWYQENVLKIPKDEVKAILLVDNTPAHPTDLESADGSIKCKFLPPNTTSILQPMDQGIIMAFKRLYRRRQLEDCLVFFENECENVGVQTLKNLKNYNLRKAIYNLSHSWAEIKTTTLKNCWNKLLIQDEMLHYDSEDDINLADLANIIRQARQTENFTEEDLENWAYIDQSDPGHLVLNEEEISASLLDQNSTEISSESEDDVETETCKITRREVLQCLDKTISYLETRFSEPEIQGYYTSVKNLRTNLLREQTTNIKQSHIETFFKPIEMNIDIDSNM